jgi:hypothetical protein
VLQCIACDSIHLVAGRSADCGCAEPRRPQPFTITWWYSYSHLDRDDLCQAGFDNLPDAQAALADIELDLANSEIVCSWQPPQRVFATAPLPI